MVCCRNIYSSCVNYLNDVEMDNAEQIYYNETYGQDFPDISLDKTTEVNKRQHHGNGRNFKI